MWNGKWKWGTQFTEKLISVNALLSSNALTEISRERQCWHVLRKLVQSSDKHLSIPYCAPATCSPELEGETVGLWHPIQGNAFPHQRARKSSLSKCFVLLRLRRCHCSPSPGSTVQEDSNCKWVSFWCIQMCSDTLEETNHTISKCHCALNKESRLELAEGLIKGTNHVTCPYSKLPSRNHYPCWREI